MLKIQPALYRIFFLIIFFVFSANELFAEVRKPSPEIKPREVIEIQLNALMKNDNTSIDYNDLLNQAKKNLATFAIPKYIRIMKNFPKTQTGKIKKNKLREDGVTVDAWQNKNI